MCEHGTRWRVAGSSCYSFKKFKTGPIIPVEKGEPENREVKPSKVPLSCSVENTVAFLRDEDDVTC
jgi:hypothetical protein